MTRLDTVGSTLFKLTWKGRTTPLGRRYLQRRALALHTRGKGFTSWPTPKGPKFSHDLAKFFREVGRTEPTDLETAALMCGWNTPIANDAEKRGVPGPQGSGLAGSVHLAAWLKLRTACSPNSLRGQGQDPEARKAGGHAVNLQDQVRLSAWATPAARDYKSESATEEFDNKRFSHPRGKPLRAEATLTVSGETRIGYSANDGIVTIGNGAQLNPEHSRWLQGLPIEFSNCADTAMQLFRKSRKRSSKATSKRKG